MKRNILTGSFAALGLLLLILDAKTGLKGANEGITLCLYTVVPALFPFFVLSALLTSSLTGGKNRLFGLLGKLCRIPEGSEILLATGLLGGYPVGAKSVAQAWEKGWLSQEDARRMLGFCSNAGPAFLFGMIAPAFGNLKIAWCLWAVHIASALLTGFLLPGGSCHEISAANRKSVTLPEALEQSVRVTALICGWVVLFRVILAFFGKWFFLVLPAGINTLLCGLLELTNGCCQLPDIADPFRRFLICSVVLAFGGVCVWMQTVSAVRDLGLGMYLPGKALQAVISLLMACITGAFLYPGENVTVMTVSSAAALAVVVGGGTLLRKKRVAIPGNMVYNRPIKFRRPNHAVPKEY